MYDSMSKARKLAVCGMCIALAFMLNQVALFRMPMGGSITPASMLFIVLAGYWLGPVYGILAGISKGFLDVAMGAFYVHPIQLLLDYSLAFGMLGLAGFFRKTRFGLPVGYVVGVTGRFVMVFLSGFIFWSGITSEAVFFGGLTDRGFSGSVVYSFVYNVTYIVPEMIATLIIISLPAMKHAIDAVTKAIVPHEDYVIMASKQGPISAKERLVTGTVIGAIGGLAFVVVSYIVRLENLAVMHFTTGAYLFREEPSRIYRLIERNTGHIAGLQTVGVLFLALGAGLLFSVVLGANEGNEKVEEIHKEAD